MTGVPTVWVTSISLVIYYVSHGVKPYDVEVASDGSGTLLFLFDKNKTAPLFAEWRASYTAADSEHKREISERSRIARQHQEDAAWQLKKD